MIKDTRQASLTSATLPITMSPSAAEYLLRANIVQSRRLEVLTHEHLAKSACERLRNGVLHAAIACLPLLEWPDRDKLIDALHQPTDCGHQFTIHHLCTMAPAIQKANVFHCESQTFG